MRSLGISQMRLRGSLTEKREREVLKASNEQLRSGRHPAASALRKTEADLDSAYILNTAPDQDEDVFTILLGGNRIIDLEVSRDGRSHQVLQVIPIAKYRPIGRSDRLRLAI